MKHSKKSLALAIILSLGVCSNAWASISIGDPYNVPGSGTSAPGTQSIAMGVAAVAASNNSIAMGWDSKTVGGTGSVAIGWDATASVSDATAVGRHAIATKDASAFGYDSEAARVGSNAIGTWSYAEADYSNAFGYFAHASGKNSTAMGTSAQATADNSVAIGYNSVADVANTISVGKAGAERRIVNVDKATTNTDALTFSNFKYNYNASNDKIVTSVIIGNDTYFFDGGSTGDIVDAELDVNSIHPVQNKAIATGINNEAATREAADNNLQNQIDNMGSDVKSVGAMAAAMAGLHPRFNGDGKGEVAAAIGSYDGKKATAIGAFYAPDERFMFSLGGAFAAGGKKMANLGVNITLDPKPHVNKKFYDEEIAQLKADNQAQAEQIQALMQRLAALEAKK